MIVLENSPPIRTSRFYTDTFASEARIDTRIGEQPYIRTRQDSLWHINSKTIFKYTHACVRFYSYHEMDFIRFESWHSYTLKLEFGISLLLIKYG